MELAQNVLSAQHWGVNDRMRSDSTTMASDGGGMCVCREPREEAIAALSS